MRRFPLSELGNLDARAEQAASLERITKLFESDGYKITITATPPPEGPAVEKPQNNWGGPLVQIVGADVLPQRLENFVGDAIVPYMAAKLYPKLLNMAGRDYNPVGVAMGLSLAMYDACQGLPPMVAAAMEFNYPELVSALVEDESRHTEILTLLNG